MSDKAQSSGTKTMQLCIDTYDEQILAGRLYNCTMSGGERFKGMFRLLGAIERALDNMEFPQPFTEMRSFAEAQEYGVELVEGGMGSTGALATFSLRVHFRRNTSWQGVVVWIEGKEQRSFRSVLELFKLIDGALTSARRQRPVQEAG